MVKHARKPSLQLRLYVAGDAPNSREAIINITELCAKHFASAYEIEVVDLLREPGRALADRIIVTPTLLRMSPGSEQRLLGNLSDTKQVLLALGAK